MCPRPPVVPPSITEASITKNTKTAVPTDLNGICRKKMATGICNMPTAAYNSAAQFEALASGASWLEARCVLPAEGPSLARTSAQLLEGSNTTTRWMAARSSTLDVQMHGASPATTVPIHYGWCSMGRWGRRNRREFRRAASRCHHLPHRCCQSCSSLSNTPCRRDCRLPYSHSACNSRCNRSRHTCRRSAPRSSCWLLALEFVSMRNHRCSH
mmetsp:Transcript_55449/g.140208  ORF Transcript_55449/g.140208 Transcript_55449/m.140208 type:complete len:213 (+) Transcript_55449:243-881(+)